MTMKRALLSLVVLALPAAASAQRFAGVMDASGVLRPEPTSVVPTPPVGSMLSSGILVIPTGSAGLVNPGVPRTLFPAGIASPLTPQVFLPAAAPFVPGPTVFAQPQVVAAPVQPDTSALTQSLPIRGTAATMAATPVVGSASGRCQTAVMRQFRSNSIHPEDLRFEGNRTSSWNTTAAAEVRGGGRLLENGRWRRFNYVCDATSLTRPRAIVNIER